ncbi:MAG: hypothetical protein ACLRMJ_01200 [Alistipes finegoldii]
MRETPRASDDDAYDLQNLIFDKSEQVRHRSRLPALGRSRAVAAAELYRRCCCCHGSSP